MPKCDFKKVTKQLHWNHTLAWVSCKFAAYFQGIFYYQHLRMVAFANFSLITESLFLAKFNASKHKITEIIDKKQKTPTNK